VTVGALPLLAGLEVVRGSFPLPLHGGGDQADPLDEGRGRVVQKPGRDLLGGARGASSHRMEGVGAKGLMVEAEAWVAGAGEAVGVIRVKLTGVGRQGWVSRGGGRGDVIEVPQGCISTSSSAAFKCPMARKIVNTIARDRSLKHHGKTWKGLLPKQRICSLKSLGDAVIKNSYVRLQGGQLITR
jgi:hypothetical protein